MKMEQQVCTLEQAKKLNELLELGQWKDVDFNYYWMKTEGSDEYFLTTGTRVGGFAYPVDSVPCFTVGELGIMLPFDTSVKRGLTKFCCRYNWYEFFDKTVRTIKANGYHQTLSKSEASARAKMLIFILENKLITVEQIKLRFTA
jgi:hypothetical protein